MYSFAYKSDSEEPLQLIESRRGVGMIIYQNSIEEKKTIRSDKRPQLNTTAHCLEGPIIN